MFYRTTIFLVRPKKSVWPLIQLTTTSTVTLLTLVKNTDRDTYFSYSNISGSKFPNKLNRLVIGKVPIYVSILTEMPVKSFHSTV